MKVRHEAPSASLDWNVQAPLKIETPSGDQVLIYTWSLAGLTWPDNAVECPKTGTLSVPFQGVDISFPVRLGQDEANGIVRLEGMSGRQRETLGLFYRGLLSGKMASSGDVITSLDTPVDLVPMGQTEEEQAQQPVKFIPRPVRVLFNIATYLLIATMVVGIVGNNIFTNLDRIDIQHGRVLAPMQTQFATNGGFVQSVEVIVGQNVQAGDVLLRLSDPETEADLETVEAQLSFAQKEYDQISEGLDELRSQLHSTNAAERVAVAARVYMNFMTDGDFDSIRQQWLSVRGRDPALAPQSDPVKVVLDLLENEAARKAALVGGLEAERDAYREILERNHVRAPTDGLVQELLVQPGQVFDADTMGLTFEAAEPRVTVGWVSERFAETVYIGMPATIGLNENGEKIKLKGTVTDVRAGDHPERPGEFGIMVSVTATDLTAEATRVRLRLGAPVNLDAKRQLGKRFKEWVSGIIGLDGA
ncbi:MAG: HlyD family efflux transporter periplasmic adaptor subunit [Pseudomonadota bacterium]